VCVCCVCVCCVCVVCGFWFLVFGFWFLVFGFWFLVFGFTRKVKCSKGGIKRRDDIKKGEVKKAYHIVVL
jgi:hypothetical protein